MEGDGMGMFRSFEVGVFWEMVALFTPDLRTRPDMVDNAPSLSLTSESNTAPDQDYTRNNDQLSRPTNTSTGKVLSIAKTTSHPSDRAHTLPPRTPSRTINHNTDVTSKKIMEINEDISSILNKTPAKP